MSVGIIYTSALVGIKAVRIRVEAYVSNGLPSFQIVGMPETAVKESRERVRSAIQNSNFEFPSTHITVNLSPADIRKEGSRYDLAIALAILIATKQLISTKHLDYDFIAELSLNGQLLPVNGILPSVLNSNKSLFIAQENAQEASLVKRLDIYPASHLTQVVSHLTDIGTQSVEKFIACETIQNEFKFDSDLADIKGQMSAKRALEIAATGFHNILLWGPPGSGKSLLAKTLPSLMPNLSEEEALETSAIASIKNGFSIDKWRLRPFRAPHHTASGVALVGGGSNPAPGEISLAHNGVLFLDELPEFERKVLEVMREPLETGHINISRATRQVTYPANFLLVAAMNPCPCGFLNDKNNVCKCSRDQLSRYLAKISGPLLDRIDMNIEVPQIPPEQLWEKNQEKIYSATVRARVTQAHKKQMQRNNNLLNSQITIKQVEQIVHNNKNLQDIIQNAMSNLSLSARSAHKVVKVARTIADMAQSETVEDKHLLEALSYRNKINF